VRNISDILAGNYGFWYVTDISDIRVASVTCMLEILVILVLFRATLMLGTVVIFKLLA
jgi:hypothetical protein